MAQQPEEVVPLPTENDEDDWIHCVDESGRNGGKVPGDNVGKWLIFAPYKFINALWYSVCIATRKGELGFAAKVSTAKDSDEDYYDRDKVICVYTYDSSDVEDVMRVRGALRRMGFTQKLPYKTDADTRAGKYSHLGHKKISLFYL